MPSIKLINQGTYGCVYHPGIKCNGMVESEKFITKIQKNDDTVQNEIRVSKIISNIKNTSRFFAPIVTSCPAKITPKIREGCDVMTKYVPGKDADYVTTKIRFVGKQNLGEYILAPTREGDDPKLKRERYIRSQKHLLRAIAKMSEHRVVHFDVKHNNVMFDARLKLPVFIDFGLSILIDDVLGEKNRDNLSRAFYTFNTYNYWPIEVIMFGYAFSKLGVEEAIMRKITAYELEHVIDVFINGKEDSRGIKTPNDLFESQLANLNKNTFKNDALHFFGKFIGKTWINMYDTLMSDGIWKRWDKYGLDVTYLFIAEDAGQELYDLIPKIKLLPS